MRRRRSGIGAELVPLVLILVCLAGSLALVITVHRRFVERSTSKSVVAVVAPPIPPAPQPKPVPPPSIAEPPAEVEEPEPPPPPAPEDPTPKALAKYTQAEAEQLLEASRADRKAAALEVARKAALAESERWRRRESLARLQLDTIDSKVRKLESQVDSLALERDALERELDVRKALASKNQSRPSQAILPHRGQNGTWRRPIVIECVNGMAILRPQGIGFGLLEIASGFGPASNPFVATIAREAIRIQGHSSPDGQAVVPYIFFLVRPDGIRSYYEARGRLEPLGITFGYELADQDWEIDFPDLDDIKTWDGSAPSHPGGPDPLTDLPGQSPGGVSKAEDEDFPSWGVDRRGVSVRKDDASGGEFVWPPKPRNSGGQGGRVNLGNLSGPGTGTGNGNGAGSGPTRSAGSKPVGLPDVPDWITTPGGTSASRAGSSGVAGRSQGGTSGSPPRGTGLGQGSGQPNLPPPPVDAPRELALGNGPITPLDPGVAQGRSAGTTSTGGTGKPAAPTVGQVPDEAPPPGLPPALEPPIGQGTGGQNQAKPNAEDDPANSFVLPRQPNSGYRGDRAGGGSPSQDPTSPDQTPPVRHVGPFTRPLAMGLDSAAVSGSPSSAVEGDPTQPDGVASGGATVASPSRSQNASGSQGSNGSNSASQWNGQPGSASGSPPSGMTPPGSVAMGGSGMPSNGMPPAGSTPPSSPSNHSSKAPSMPDVPAPKIIDRRLEIVLVCGPRGVIVQPGSYRVTVDALKDRDGLLKKQMVALVKARRTADPKVTIEPRVRFLIQPGGEKTYFAARSQFLLTGLEWPMTTQVADPDHLSIIPSETW